MESDDSEQAAILLSVQKTLRGDTDAFSVIVQEFSGPLYSLARNYGRSREDAEEDVQEIFLNSFRSLSQFNLSKQFKPWLFQIAVNHLKSTHRRRIRRFLLAEVVNAENKVLEEVAFDNTPSPEHQALERLVDEDVLRVLSRLPKKWRDVFILTQMQGLSGREVSHILEIPEETIRTYLFRSRKELQKYVKNRGWI